MTSQAVVETTASRPAPTTQLRRASSRLDPSQPTTQPRVESIPSFSSLATIQASGAPGLPVPTTLADTRLSSPFPALPNATARPIDASTSPIPALPTPPPTVCVCGCGNLLPTARFRSYLGYRWRRFLPGHQWTRRRRLLQDGVSPAEFEAPEWVLRDVNATISVIGEVRAALLRAAMEEMRSQAGRVFHYNRSLDAALSDENELSLGGLLVAGDTGQAVDVRDGYLYSYTAADSMFQAARFLLDHGPRRASMLADALLSGAPLSDEELADIRAALLLIEGGGAPAPVPAPLAPNAYADKGGAAGRGMRKQQGHGNKHTRRGMRRRAAGGTAGGIKRDSTRQEKQRQTERAYRLTEKASA